MVKDKAVLSYPEVNKKKKKIVRKEIKVARMDSSDNQLVESMRKKGQSIGKGGASIIIVKDGMLIKYEGLLSDITQLVHQMQRIVTPLIPLDSEEKVLSFLDNSASTIWEEDYTSGLVPKGKESFDLVKRMDEYSRQIGFNTRVIGFYFDKKEYGEEIDRLAKLGITGSDRYNLRIGVVTDPKLIQRMKKSRPNLFLDVGLSVMVLKRYDGEVFKLNVAEELPDNYHRFIISNSVKPIEQFTPAVSQLREGTSKAPLIMIYVDFSEPKVRARSEELLKIIEEIQPRFAKNYVFTWTDDLSRPQDKRDLGITWDELPALALNSNRPARFVYPRGQPMEKELISKWLSDISQKRSDNDESLVTTEIAQNQKDFTIYKHFLEKSIDLTMKEFYDQVLNDETDAVVFFYSTEEINYLQRKIAFQYNLAVEILSKDERVAGKVKFYSLDAYKYGLPRGIPARSGPPRDLDGSMIGT